MLNRPSTAIERNTSESRYDLLVDGELAGFARYHLEGERVVLFDTKIAPTHRGEGLGQQLAQAVLEDIRARGILVEPQCEFIAAYIHEHPEHHDLVAAATSKDRTAA